MNQYSQMINKRCKNFFLEMENNMKMNIHMHERLFANLVSTYCLAERQSLSGKKAYSSFFQFNS